MSMPVGVSVSVASAMDEVVASRILSREETLSASRVAAALHSVPTPEEFPRWFSALVTAQGVRWSALNKHDTLKLVCYFLFFKLARNSANTDLAYPTRQHFLHVFPQFSYCGDKEIRKLMEFANWTSLVLEYIPGAQNKKFFMQLIPMLAEGVGVKYTMGGGAKQTTRRREQIFSFLSGVPVLARDRKPKSGENVKPQESNKLSTSAAHHTFFLPAFVYSKCSPDSRSPKTSPFAVSEHVEYAVCAEADANQSFPAAVEATDDHITDGGEVVCEAELFDMMDCEELSTDTSAFPQAQPISNTAVEACAYAVPVPAYAPSQIKNEQINNYIYQQATAAQVAEASWPNYDRTPFPQPHSYTNAVEATVADDEDFNDTLEIFEQAMLAGVFDASPPRSPSPQWNELDQHSHSNVQNYGDIAFSDGVYSVPSEACLWSSVMEVDDGVDEQTTAGLLCDEFLAQAASSELEWNDEETDTLSWEQNASSFISSQYSHIQTHNSGCMPNTDISTPNFPWQFKDSDASFKLANSFTSAQYASSSSSGPWR